MLSVQYPYYYYYWDEVNGIIKQVIASCLDIDLKAIYNFNVYEVSYNEIGISYEILYYDIDSDCSSVVKKMTICKENGKYDDLMNFNSNQNYQNGGYLLYNTRLSKSDLYCQYGNNNNTS